MKEKGRNQRHDIKSQRDFRPWNFMDRPEERISYPDEEIVREILTSVRVTREYEIEEMIGHQR